MHLKHKPIHQQLRYTPHPMTYKTIALDFTPTSHAHQEAIYHATLAAFATLGITHTSTDAQVYPEPDYHKSPRHTEHYTNYTEFAQRMSICQQNLQFLGTEDAEYDHSQISIHGEITLDTATTLTLIISTTQRTSHTTDLPFEAPDLFNGCSINYYATPQHTPATDQLLTNLRNHIHHTLRPDTTLSDLQQQIQTLTAENLQLKATISQQPTDNNQESDDSHQKRTLKVTTDLMLLLLNKINIAPGKQLNTDIAALIAYTTGFSEEKIRQRLSNPEELTSFHRTEVRTANKILNSLDLSESIEYNNQR